MVWKQVQHDRRKAGDLNGIEGGVDRTCTLKLYNSNASRKVRGALRHILTGAVWTQASRAKMPQNAGMSTTCTHCTTGEHEDLKHLWWSCAAWTEHRGRVRPEVREAAIAGDLPACLSNCGVLPEGYDQFGKDTADIQQMMAEIYVKKITAIER